MRTPWHDDQPLSVGDVRALLAADAIPLPLERVEAFASGWDFKTFRVDGDWLFRFPRRRDCGPYFKRETETLRYLNGALARSPIQIPRYAWVVTQPKTFPWPYGGYRFLEGAPVLHLDPQQIDLRASARHLGAFLRGLHACRPSAAPKRVVDPFPNYLVSIREELDQLRPALPARLADACARLLEGPYPIWEGRPAFVHADLAAEHLLIDEASGTLVGIIDWGDARWGDPLIDLVGWWAWGGDAAVAEALDAYGRELDVEEWARLRFRGASVAVTQAYYGYASGREAMLRRSTDWLARMLDAGQLDDVFTADRGETP